LSIHRITECKGGSWRPGDPVERWQPMAGRLRLKSVEACEREDWSLLSWPSDVSWDPKTGEISNPSGSEPVRRRFLCGSWRCRRCSRWRGAIDWARCAEAVASRTWWLYLVLTFDPAAYSGPWEAFQQAGQNWHHHLKPALQAKGGKLAYLQTWEQHQSGWPHANLILTGDRLQRFVEQLGIEDGSVTKHGKTRRTKFPRGFRDWLVSKATAAGFGSVLWVEVIDDEVPEALAGYLTKLARELTGAPGGAKGDQSPTMAPRHFRRIRASRGLLPKALATAGTGKGKYTGCLSRTRTGTDPTPRRATGQRRELVKAAWSEVVAAIEAEESRQRRTQDVRHEVQDGVQMDSTNGLQDAMKAILDYIDASQPTQTFPMPEVSQDVCEMRTEYAPTRVWRADEF
jgi:hypothetical protein